MENGTERWLLNAPCGIFSINTDGVVIAANPYCITLLEYDEHNLIVGKNISQLLTLPSRIFYQTHLFPLVKLHKHAEEIFVNLQSRSKKQIPVVLNALEWVEEGNEYVTFSFVPVFNRRKYEDEILMAKKKAEDSLKKNEALERVTRELEQQQKALDQQVNLLRFQNQELLQLSDIVAHDLQEPIRKLILFSNELQAENIEPEKREHALSVLKKSSQKIKNLLVNLQEYLGLTIEATGRDPVSLDDLLLYELKQLRKSYPSIELSLQVESLGTIAGDKNQLSWMFHHLLKNAFDHGAINNQLSLSIEAVIIKENVFNSTEEKYVYVDFIKVTIKDEGPGFDKKYDEHVFKVLKGLNLKGEHLGFGLAFCRRIAENHNGTIKADGESGKGATFTILLPLSVT